MPALDEKLENALWKVLEELEFEHQTEHAVFLEIAERDLVEQLQARAFRKSKDEIPEAQGSRRTAIAIDRWIGEEYNRLHPDS